MKREQAFAKVKAKGPKKVNKDQFVPGVRIIVQDHKSKCWNHRAIIVNQRSKRTYTLDDGSIRFVRNQRFFFINPEQETEVPSDQETEMLLDTTTETEVLPDQSVLSDQETEVHSDQETEVLSKQEVLSD